MEDKGYIVVGRINGLHGVRGWVKVFSHTQPRENILSYRTWYLSRGGQWVATRVVNGRQQGKGIVAQLEGCDDRDAATALMESVVAIRREQLADTAPGEYYWADLQGLRVINAGGVELGVVDHLLETGANDVLVVHDDGTERLIPYVMGQFVLEVKLGEGTIRVDWDPDF
ncbi:MAG: ribosome maturation factor RimM [Chromatiales bacterium]|nr:ribosome maturation factor RimM [Chromatiales bacterium]